MLLNEDVSVRTVVHAGKADWVPSPIKGVERRMLFRIGDEKARATVSQHDPAPVIGIGARQAR